MSVTVRPDPDYPIGSWVLRDGKQIGYISRKGRREWHAARTGGGVVERFKSRAEAVRYVADNA